MIQVEFGSTGDKMSLRVEGHAGFSELGQDIVCAGVSSLGQALLFGLECMGLGMEYSICPGELRVEAVRTDASCAMFCMCFAGMSAISQKYPRNVIVRGEIAQTPLLQ